MRSRGACRSQPSSSSGGYGGETIGLSDDDAVVIVKRCPFLSHGHMLATDYEHVFSRCMALVLSAVPLLNENYTARFVRTICTGDRQCEIKIEKKAKRLVRRRQRCDKKNTRTGSPGRSHIPFLR